MDSCTILLLLFIPPSVLVSVNVVPMDASIFSDILSLFLAEVGMMEPLFSSKALVCGDSISFCTIVAFSTGVDSMQVFTFFNERNSLHRDEKGFAVFLLSSSLSAFMFTHSRQHLVFFTATFFLAFNFFGIMGVFFVLISQAVSFVPFPASLVSFLFCNGAFQTSFSLLVFFKLALVLDQAQSLVRSFPLVPFPVFPSCSFPCLSLLFLSLSFPLVPFPVFPSCSFPCLSLLFLSLSFPLVPFPVFLFSLNNKYAIPNLECKKLDLRYKITHFKFNGISFGVQAGLIS